MPCLRFLVFFVAIVLFTSSFETFAENCTIQGIYDALQPLQRTFNFTTCQTDTNYTMMAPSVAQTREFCKSSACQALLTTTLYSSKLPDCEVVGRLKLRDVLNTVASKCEDSEQVLSLKERAVDDSEPRSKAQRISDHVATILGHSAPMDEVGQVVGALLGVFRK